MPLKLLRLKKSRQYNVVSKSLYVICVELLDSTSIECTLSAESVGQECLDSVCQRLGLHQPEILGLRYISRARNPRWVDLSRPLKRQLDKYASHFSLYLRVMYFITNVSFIKDEMTRYHFFLQLKMDVIEGRILCDADQAVLLASYSMQAEFGDHDLEKHTSEYLKDFQLFPKQLIAIQGRLESLTEAVICQHLALAGLPQGTAEEYYIIAAQQLEGYGQEKFLAKDDNSSEVTLAVSLRGVTIQNQNKNTIFHQWEDIANVINHKRYFSIEEQHENFIQFQFNDVETAKYVWNMCVLQHMFYGLHEKIDQTGDNKADIMRKNLKSHFDNNIESSREELDSVDAKESGMIRGSFPFNGVRAQSTSCLDLSSSQASEKARLEKNGHKSISKLPSYRLAPDYETAVQRKYSQGDYYNPTPNLIPTTSISHQNINLHQYNNDYKQFPDVTQVNIVSPVHPIHGKTSELDISAQDAEYIQIFKPPPPYPISYSTPDLARACPLGYIQNPVSGSSPDLLSSRGHNCQIVPNRYNTSHMLTNSDTHRTYTNLNALLEPKKNLDEFRTGFNGNNMMYYMGQHGPILNQPITSMIVNERPHNCSAVLGKCTEPIYENVPLPWNSKDVRSRAAGAQVASEIKSPISKVPHQAQPVKEEITVEKQKHEVMPIKNNTLDISSSSNVSSQLVSTSIIHSAEQSFDSSNQSSSSGTLKKEGRSKNRRKWAGLLSGAVKSKTLNRNGDISVEEFNKRHSTVPRLPIPSTISKDTMCQILEHKLEDTQLFHEFDKITKVKPNAEFSTAFVLENYSRNRHKDILPYEENRVRLSPSKENRFGYINASHITASVGNEQRFYIATQTPLPSTVNHFWQMVWEAGVHLVLDLSLPKINSIDENYGKYFPTVADHSVQFGEYHVWLQFTQETGHCVTSKLKLQHNSSRRSRSVWHLRYDQWVEQDCPTDVSHFLGFLEEMSSVREHTITEIPTGQNRNPPILVHCSTGVGRTGLTVLTDLLLYTLDHNQELDIPKTISLARHQRMLFVETVAQYKFVHSLLIYYLKNSRLI